MLPPASKLPGLVNTLRWMADPDGSLERDAAHFGDAYLIRNLLFGTEAVFSHPSALKEIFTGDSESFAAGEANEILGPVLGSRSVLLLDGADHLHVRKLMLPAFHGERMRNYTATMAAITRRALASFHRGARLGLQAVFQQITLDVILQTVLGLGEEGPALAKARAQIIHLLDRVQSPTGALWLLPLFRRDLGRLTPWASMQREIVEIDRMLREHIARRRASEEKKDDVLDRLIHAVDEEGQGLDDLTLVSQLKTLLLAGHETSANSLSWVFEELLRVPGEQERLREEVESVTGGAQLTAEHLPKLTRLDSVLKEALRLHPVTAAIGRILKKPTTVSGYDLPVGVMVVASIHTTHRRPDLYPDPTRFVPDRFVGKKIDPYEWLPFGVGLHRCLGMAFALHEMKVIMATILGAGVKLRLAEEGPLKTTLRSLFYAPKGGTKVVVEAEAEAAAA